MSNKAYLIAEDTPEPYDRYAEGTNGSANTVQVAGAAYQIPAFWFFCFEKNDLLTIKCEDNDVPTLVASISQVHTRLSARKQIALELFATHHETWNEFCREIEGLTQRYLKCDVYEIWCMGEGLELAIAEALDWFDSRPDPEPEALLFMASIENYNRKSTTFKVPTGECAERYLVGWLGDD